MSIANVDSLAKFSSNKYRKIPINRAKGLLRLLCLEPRQYVPLHRHPNADEYFYVVMGEGKLMMGKKKHEARSGYIIKVHAGVEHQWKNGSQRLVLLSMLVSPQSYELADETTKMEFT